MIPDRLPIRRAAVLGAGVMGAQIAAHLAAAGVETLLFDLPAREGDKNGIVLKAIAGLKKLSPPPLARPELADALIPCNYEQHLDRLAGADFVIEAVAERMDIKRDLYRRIAPCLGPTAVLASNTSGLSINALAGELPETLRPRFCGVHFFNPPRYMHLVELIPHAATDPGVLDALEGFLTSALGKGVVRAKDTPNFIGNRIGVFSILAAMHHTEALGLGFDVVDALTGPAIGRPKSATYRTADVVGLDTMQHVIRTMAEGLAEDPWHRHFQSPAWLSALIEKGALGQKSGAGFYRKRGSQIEVLDLGTRDYRPAGVNAGEVVQAILSQRDPAARLRALRESDDPEARFLWSVFRDLFHYAAYHLEAIADSAREVDQAMRWGYGWQQGPFETWQAAGWRQVAGWIADDIAQGRAMSSAPLPEWVFRVEAVHGAAGSFSPARGAPLPRPTHPVYRRQRLPERLLGEPEDRLPAIFETEVVRLADAGDGVAVLSFRTKMNTISPAAIEGVHRALDHAEAKMAALVIWQEREPFSAGADLSAAVAAVQAGRFAEFEAMVARFQQTSQRLKYSLVPVVAAVRGMALGGGCEFQMHCARTVAALESYIGLVEAGVGLLPAGGGLKEIALRASRAGSDPMLTLKPMFETVAMAKVSGSALEAKAMGLLRESDVVVFHPRELLHAAKHTALGLAEGGYRPPLPARRIAVAGRPGIAQFLMQLTNLREGGFISEHDHEVARRIAIVLCGGEIEAGCEVDEDWLLALEREHFVALAAMPKTQERILHTLKTGKPLRN
jgi:3-hydroxyacyl-CoA dehydrogenase